MKAEFDEIIKIKEIIGNNPKGINIKDIAKQMDSNRDTVARFLKILQVKGDVSVNQVSTAKLFTLSKRVPISVLSNYCQDPYIIVNRWMRITHCNTKYTELFKCNSKVLTQNKIYDLHNPLFKEPDLVSLYKPALEGSSFSKHIHTTINESDYYLLTRMIPLVFDNGEEGFGIVFSDETEYKKRISSTEISDSRYQAIIEGMNEYVCRFLPDGTITYANTAYCRMTNRNRESLIGRRLPRMSTHGDLADMLHELSPDSPMKNINMHTILYDGRESWQRWDLRAIYGNGGEPIECQAVGHDISQFKQIEEDLKQYRTNLKILVEQRTEELEQTNKKLLQQFAERKEIEEKLNFAIESSNLGVWDWDLISREFIINKKGAEILGFPPKKIEENLDFWRKLLHPDDREKIMKITSGKCDQYNKGYRVQFRLKHQNGNWIRVYGTGEVSCRDENDNPIRITGLFADITQDIQNKKLLQMQRDLNKALAETNDLDTALSLCIESAIQVSGMDAGAFYIFNKKTGDFNFRYSTGISEESIKALSHTAIKRRLKTVKNNENAIYTNFGDSDFAIFREKIREELHALALIRVYFKQNLLGCCALCSHTVDDIPQSEKERLELIVTPVGSAIERIQAENSVKIINQRYQTAFDSITDGVRIINRNFIVTAVNNSFLEKLKLKKEEVIGKTCFRALWKLETPCENCPVQSVFESGHHAYIERNVVFRNGERALINSIATPVYDNTGHIIEVVCSSRDITKLKLTDGSVCPIHQHQTGNILIAEKDPEPL